MSSMISRKPVWKRRANKATGDFVRDGFDARQLRVEDDDAIMTAGAPHKMAEAIRAGKFPEGAMLLLPCQRRGCGKRTGASVSEFRRAASRGETDDGWAVLDGAIVYCPDHRGFASASLSDDPRLRPNRRIRNRRGKPLPTP